jgi:hypothetical protein
MIGDQFLDQTSLNILSNLLASFPPLHAKAKNMRILYLLKLKNSREL